MCLLAANRAMLPSRRTLFSEKGGTKHMTTEELGRIPLLAGIDGAILERCAADNQMTIRHFAKGATVHQQSDPCTGLDVVLSGSLVAYALSENGSAMNLFQFEKNSVIGANLLFGDGNVYPLNIYCETACQVCHIEKGAVAALLRDYGFVLRYIESLSLNSRGMNRKITMIVQRTLRENLLLYLRQQAARQGTARIALSVSKKQLADYLGVQRPSLFRELKKLRDEGVIRFDRHAITLLKEPL
jgi:CRP-like cAMP-binding protein